MTLKELSRRIFQTSDFKLWAAVLADADIRTSADKLSVNGLVQEDILRCLKKLPSKRIKEYENIIKSYSPFVLKVIKTGTVTVYAKEKETALQRCKNLKDYQVAWNGKLVE